MNTNTHRINVITLTLTSLLGFGAAVGAANCAQAAEPAGIKVSYADLNLARGSDVQTLYQRIERAASAACEQSDPRDLARHRAYVRCFDAAVEAAVADVHSPELLAVERANRTARAS